jgi:hypothetical protein
MTNKGERRNLLTFVIPEGNLRFAKNYHEL